MSRPTIKCECPNCRYWRRTPCEVGERPVSKSSCSLIMDHAPKRIQRKRSRGWRMPPNTVYVGRPSRWGNPFRLGSHPVGGTIDLVPIYQPTPEGVLTAFRTWAQKYFRDFSALRGKDLACWCKEGAPCHADILLELANQ